MDIRYMSKKYVYDLRLNIIKSLIIIVTMKNKKAIRPKCENEYRTSIIFLIFF